MTENINLQHPAWDAEMPSENFHHGNEELLFVLAGTPTLRRGPEDERTLAPGEVVSFPVGHAGSTSGAAAR